MPYGFMTNSSRSAQPPHLDGFSFSNNSFFILLNFFAKNKQPAWNPAAESCAFAEWHNRSSRNRKKEGESPDARPIHAALHPCAAAAALMEQPALPAQAPTEHRQRVLPGGDVPPIPAGLRPVRWAPLTPGGFALHFLAKSTIMIPEKRRR
ncbi:MAG: hypothetical protein VB055_01165 [Oscillospiraceae bacterium]|nr:hypothetical protein [Oscillospiraceae bacterium]